MENKEIKQTKAIEIYPICPKCGAHSIPNPDDFDHYGCCGPDWDVQWNNFDKDNNQASFNGSIVCKCPKCGTFFRQYMSFKEEILEDTESYEELFDDAEEE